MWKRKRFLLAERILYHKLYALIVDFEWHFNPFSDKDKVNIGLLKKAIVIKWPLWKSAGGRD